MADAKKPAAPAAKPDAKTGPRKKTGGALRMATLMIVLVCAAPFIFPTIVLCAIGMMPSLIALLVDNDPRKSSTAAISLMNGAGLTPFILDLWMKGQTMPNAFAILRDPSNWLIILGAAAIGQLIVFAIPSMMANLTILRAEARLKTLRANLDQLKTGWGPDVATTKPMDEMVRK